MPQIPTGFVVTEQYPTDIAKTVTFEWDEPRGIGPELIVDYYLISITPQPRSHPIINNVSSSPWNVTLDFNVAYITTITAVNCAGQSMTLVLPESEFSKCQYYNQCQ